MRRLTSIARPSGTYVVIVGRTDVQPSSGCTVGFPVWAYTRLRWQIGSRTWSVDVFVPRGEHGLKAQVTRRAKRWEFPTRQEAEAFVAEAVDQVRQGEFDIAKVPFRLGCGSGSPLDHAADAHDDGSHGHEVRVRER